MSKRKKTQSPTESLREQLYDIKFSEDIKVDKKTLNIEEITKLARKVKRTFKNENITYPKLSF